MSFIVLRSVSDHYFPLRFMAHYVLRIGSEKGLRYTPQVGGARKSDLNRIDDAKCEETVRTLRWHDKFCCVRCNSEAGPSTNNTAIPCSRSARDTSGRIAVASLTIDRHRCRATPSAAVHEIRLAFPGLNLPKRQFGHQLDLNNPANT